MLIKLYKFLQSTKQYISYTCYTISLNNKNNNKNNNLLFLKEYFPEFINEDEFNKLNKLNKLNNNIIEIGPRSRELTSWSTNVMSIFKKSGITFINYIINSTIYISKLDANYLFETFHDRMTDLIYGTKGSNSFFTRVDYNKKENIIDYLSKINDFYGFSLTNYDYKYILNNFSQWEDPLFAIFDIAQSNSEHSRHHFFNGNLLVDNKNINNINNTLFKLVKEPLKKNNKNSLVAFSDNSSVIKGYNCNFMSRIFNNNTYQYQVNNKHIHFLLTAETHNFPTGIAPFPGAATGIGGRIRDVQATGRGAFTVCGSAGYCVGDIYNNNKEDYPFNMEMPRKILIEASNGASDYGNKFGEPIILGFTNIFSLKHKEERIEWVKPIMFTSGLGMIHNKDINKNPPNKDMLICKIGGPVYRIGLGGSSASSRVSSSYLDYLSVQRDDAEMEQKMDKVIKHCLELENNPIESIHDQGAGGNGNVLKEIIEDKGAVFDIGKLTLGERNLSNIEIWLSEYQESNAILVLKENIDKIQEICNREYVTLDIVGTINENKVGITIKNGNNIILNNYIVEEKIPQRTYKLDSKIENRLYFSKIEEIYNTNNTDYKTLHLEELLEKVLKNGTVGSKRFLTNKVDRSVTGLIAQQQCVGPLHTPLSNFGLFCQSYFPDKNGNFKGCATSIGSQPIVGLFDPISLVHKSIAEMLTNLMWVVIEDFEHIKCSANWMWPIPNKDSKEGYKMYIATKELNKILIELGIAIDGGKDSLSMAVNHKNRLIKSPGTLVLSSYVDCPNIYNKVSPDLKSNNSTLLFIDLSKGYMNMAGSIAQEYLPVFYSKSKSTNPPLIRDIKKLKTLFLVIQQLIKDDLILSGHDKSDGGLLVTLLEMAFAGNRGLDIILPYGIDKDNTIEFLFNEEVGVVIECLEGNKQLILDICDKHKLTVNEIAKTHSNNNITIESHWLTNYYKKEMKNINDSITYSFSTKENNILNNKMTILRSFWEYCSYDLEKDQCKLTCVEQENKIYQEMKIPEYNLTFDNLIDFTDLPFNNLNKRKYTVGIIREEGTNSERELAAAFYHAGFNVVDINTYDLINETISLKDLNGIGFAGGFSYSDVLGSGKGWYNIINYNKKIREQFNNFYKREDTFSIGICNGCQLMSHLGWVSCKLEQNTSKRFESRFSTVKINNTNTNSKTNSNSIFLKNMEDLVFGIWVAHGEGRFIDIKDDNNIAIQYVDFNNKPTLSYPHNPNGSYKGTAAVSSNNGRHLAIMPHPERTFLRYQVPWSNIELAGDYSPWFQIFINARKWVETN